MDLPRSAIPSIQAAPEPDEHVKTRLLRAAVRVFDRKGFTATSVREITDMAGVTKPVLYYHFGSKEGLLIAVLDQARRQFAAIIERALARAGTARERTLALCEDVYALFEQNVPTVRVAHAVFLGPPDAVPEFDVSVFDSLFVGAVEQIVTDGLAAGELRRVAPRDVALAVGGILQGCNERQLHPAFDKVGTKGVRRLIGFVFDGIAHAPGVQGAESQ